MSFTNTTHTHTNLTTSVCPYAKSPLHGWCPKQEGDHRSPCPAINTLANHGYIRRSGQSISLWQMVVGLRQAYGLSYPLALFLTIGGFILLHHWNFFRPLDLHELRRHNRVEHNASLVHDDTPSGKLDAPNAVIHPLIDRFFAEIRKSMTSVAEKKIHTLHDTERDITVDYMDVAKARIRRQGECGEIDGMHQEIARGEMAIILGVWETEKLGLPKSELAVPEKSGIPGKWLEEWFSDERLPAEWEARLQTGQVQSTGLIETVKRSSSIRKAMEMLTGSH